MSFISSSTTINLQSCLTETGRKYLFGIDDKTRSQIRFDQNGNDLFIPKNFSLYDGETNYKSSQKLSSGDVPNLNGSGFTHGLFTCADSKRKNTLVNSYGFNPNVTFEYPNFYIIEKIGNSITLDIKLEQYFNYDDLGQVSYLLYVDTDNTNFKNFTIEDATNLTLNSIDYYGKVYNPSIGSKKEIATILITSSETLTEDQKSFITLRLIPINNCDNGLTTSVKINVNGTVLPNRNITFETNLIEVENKQANGTVENFVNILLSENDFKNNRRVDVEILFGQFLGPISLSLISIELMKPVTQNTLDSDQTQVLLSRSYISTFVENEKPLPIFFDANTNKISFKIVKPYLNNIVSVDILKNQLSTLTIQLSTLTSTHQSLVALLRNLGTAMFSKNSQKTTQQNLINSLVEELAILTSDKNMARNVSTFFTNSFSNSSYRDLATKYGFLNQYLTKLSSFNSARTIAQRASTEFIILDLFKNEIQNFIDNLITQKSVQITTETSKLNTINNELSSLQLSMSNAQVQLTNLDYINQKLFIESEIKKLEDIIVLGTSIYFRIIKTYNNTTVSTYDYCNYLIVN